MIVVGASGHGIHDLVALLEALPANLGAAILVVLHRPALPSYLRDLLAARASMPVIIAEDGERLMPGVCYLGRPTEHLMVAANGRAELLHDPAFACRNRTIDALFMSVAQRSCAGAVGVLLSGSLNDGSLGLRNIHVAGGTTMVCTPRHGVWGDMPRNAIALSTPHFIDSIPHLATRVGEVVGCSIQVE